MNVNENINIRRILDILISKKILIAFILIIFTTLGYLYSYKYIVPEYKSSSTLLLIPNSSSETQTITNSDLTLNSSLISTYSNIAKNTKVLKQVISNLNLKMSENELLNKITVNNAKNTYIIEITTKDTNPKKAMAITKELANVFLEEIQEIYHLNNVGIVDSANLPDIPYNINHAKDLLMFFALGIFASLSLVMIIYIFNNKIEKEEDIEKYIDLKSLGIIPINKNNKEEIIDKKDIKSYANECINTIRTNILYMNVTKNAKSILITSCTPGEGKSWVSANIATSFSDINKKVLLIDADLRKGRASKIFGINNHEGLAEYLYSMTGNDKNDLELAKKYIKETKIPNLHILTNGSIPQNPSELLASNNMKELMKLLKNTYDIIIVDAPPTKLVTDSVILSTIVDSTALVIHSSKTRVNDLKDASKSINLVGGEIIGAILNKVKISGTAYKKNYYYGNSNTKDICSYTPQLPTFISVNEIINNAIKNLNESILEKPYNEEVPKLEQKYQEPNLDNFVKKVSNKINNIENTVNAKVKQLINNNNETLNIIQTKVNELNQEINKENNNKNTSLEKLETLFNTKMQEIISNNNSAFEKMQYVLDNNSIALQISNSNSKNLENINSKVQEIINSNNNRFENIQNALNSNLQNMFNYNKTNLENMIHTNNQNNKLENMAIKEEISLILQEQLAKISQETANLIKNQISNISYNEQIAEIKEVIGDLRDNYSELYNTVMNLNNKDYRNSPYYAKNIIDIQSYKTYKENKPKDLYDITKEVIKYEDLEKTAICNVPINSGKIRSFLPKTYENIM